MLRKLSWCKRLTSVIVVVTTLTSSTIPDQGRELTPVPDYRPGHILVKGDQHYPPFEFINEKGEPDGFNVELFTALSKMLGLQYTLELGPWQEVRTDLENGDCDVLLGLMVSEERAEKMTFGTPHNLMTHGIFARKGATFKTLADLKGKEVVVQEKDLMHDLLLQKQITQKIITVPSQLEALQLIARGKHDAALIGNFQGEHLISKHKIGNIRMTSGEIQPYYYAMAVHPDREELLWLLNLGLYQLKESGEYTNIYNKWFGVYEKRSFLNTYKPHLITGAAAILLLLLFIFLLRYRVKRVTRQLKAAKIKAEESDKLKTAFLNNISHEIRTPLNGIMGFSELISNTNPGPEEKNTYAAMIHQCSNQLINTIDNIITIAKVESGQARIENSEVHLPTLMHEIQQMADLKIDTKRISLTVTVDLPEESHTIITDKIKLITILTKLVNNAVKFTETGSISVECTEVNQHIRFVVTDTGIGISHEQQHNLFKKFITPNTSKTALYRGTGLGLAITKAYTDLLGGTLRMESETGKGTRITCSIPLVKPKQIAATKGATKTSTVIPKSNDMHILITEDEETNRTLVETLVTLEFPGAIIYLAANGKEAVEAVKEHQQINLILMDIKMPVMDGCEATKEIRKLRPEIPVIALSAYTLGDEKRKIMETDFQSFLGKPIRKEELYNTINHFTDPAIAKSQH